KPPGRAAAHPRGELHRFGLLDLLERVALPAPTVRLAQARVKARLEANPRPHDLGRLARPAQVRRPQRPDRVAQRGHSRGQLARLRAAGVVQRRVAEALEADRLEIVIGLSVTGQQHAAQGVLSTGAHRPPMPSVSERSPRRSVSRAGISPTGTLLRFTSSPNLRTNQTCWSLRG